MGVLLPGQRLMVPAAIAVSAALHLSLVAVGAVVVRRELAPQHPAVETLAPASIAPVVEIEPPSFRADSLDPDPARLPEASEPPHPSGGAPLVPRPDAARRGRGGDDTARLAAVNLADRDDGIRLSPELQSRVDRDQLQRLATSKSRRSWEDGRYTTHPMELTFLATGSGRTMDRRRWSDHDPSRGIARSAPAAVEGAIRIGIRAAPVGEDEPRRPVGGPVAGRASGAPGVGIPDGAPGSDHRASAAIASARPMVRQGPPSIPADVPGKPKDTVDSAQEVAASNASLTHASPAGGRPGEGRGGEAGPGPTGSGGREGPGSRSEALGPGGGGFYAPNQYDPRLTSYQRRMAARLYPLWENAFPRWAAEQMRQGTVIIAFTLAANGSVHQPHVRRTSGIAQFDQGCLDAVRRASPFEPLPANLGVRSMYWEVSFEASNPVVR